MLKHQDFSLALERHFTDEKWDALDLIHFRADDDYADQLIFEAPDNWSQESANLLGEEAGHRDIPAETKLIEENTVPSWLWRRSAEGFERIRETSVRQIFNRVAGAAAYSGWKKDIFANESEARIFFDEVRYMLAQRFIALDPLYFAGSGIDWAYGLDTQMPFASSSQIQQSIEATDFSKTQRPAIADIRNATIDSLLAGDKAVQTKWRKFIEAGTQAGFLSLRFIDIAADWNSDWHTAARAGIDLLAFRREDGAVHIARLQHAVRLLVILLGLQKERTGASVSIGLHNLAPLLMSQGLAYDSEAARTTAAALSAVVTAEAYATSGQLAARLGPSLDFAANRQAILRTLRNHRRAVYGDRNDYEKISVLPAPLLLDEGADLSLFAAARQRWDHALRMVQQNGLCFTHLTNFAAANGLSFFMESATHGIAPMPALSIPFATESGAYRQELHPAVNEGLIKLGYDNDTRASILNHMGGHRTLNGAPGINHQSLARLGFNADTLEAVENYIQNVDDIRLAFTPWVLGEEFCRDKLKITADEITGTELLLKIGFTENNITAANNYVYGNGTAIGAKGLRPAHTGVFAQTRETTTDARVRMAAAVQGLISGETGLQLTLLTKSSIADIERAILNIWRKGVKSLAIEFVTPIEKKAKTKTIKKMAAKAALQPQAYPAVRPALRNRPKASDRLVGQQSNGKSGKRRNPRPHGRG